MLALHKFDLALCNHAILNIVWNFDEPRVFAHVANIRSPLGEFFRGRHNKPIGPIPKVLLSDDEFDSIVAVLRFLPLRAQVFWTPYESMYVDRSLVTGEIRRLLAPAEADHWATISQRNTTALMQEELPLWSGIEIVQNWTWDLRRYLEALCEFGFLPTPRGHFPTISNPEPSAVSSISFDPLEIYVARLQEAFNSDPSRKTKRPAELIKELGLNNRLARAALRVLEERGVYSGFKRKRPGRYQPST
jgi:hypothetical protein